MFQNNLLAEYHGTFHDTPWTKRFIVFVNLQKQVWLSKRLHQHVMSKHKLALLIFALMSACPLGKNPILPQSLDYELSIQPP